MGGRDGDPAIRTAFAVDIWDDDDNWAVSVTNRSESPWDHIEFLGNILDREEALNHPLIKDVFHITDHIVLEDKPVVQFFS